MHQMHMLRKMALQLISIFVTKDRSVGSFTWFIFVKDQSFLRPLQAPTSLDLLGVNQTFCMTFNYR